MPQRKRGMDGLVDRLVAEGILTTPGIIDAFRTVDRALFVVPEARPRAYEDLPLPIGHGQTISQPLTVAVMLEALRPATGDYCLDVGAGSGWAAALLGTIVGPRGRVVAVERLPQLRLLAERNIAACGLTNIDVRHGNAAHGWPERAPYDVIHVAAAAAEVPEALRAQLALKGRFVLPVGETVQDLAVIQKIRENEYTERRIPGFQFVPLIS